MLGEYNDLTPHRENYLVFPIYQSDSHLLN
jgi:hypothetical protein